jgi:hypothetical protein
MSGSGSTASVSRSLPGTPEEFSAYIRSEIEKWKRVVKSQGITAE